MFASGRDKMGRASNEPRGKGDNWGKAPLCPVSKDYREQIPSGLSQQTMLYPTIGPNITIIYVGNQVAKKSEINALPYV